MQKMQPIYNSWLVHEYLSEIGDTPPYTISIMHIRVYTLRND